ncbi:MAG TPA: hypothetical protein VKZ97_08435, partial [Flavobacteriaceae bacterium]|nr:hypothetical protein [Flavobacteriaceae bacterium]
MKFNFFSKTTMVVVFIILTGCSKENAPLDFNSSNEHSEDYLMREESSQVTDYLTAFYDTDRENISYRHDVETDDGTISYIVTEITVGTDSIARGYVATDETTGDLLYFVDVDRVNYTLTAIDVSRSISEVINNINEHEDYYET